MQIAKKVQAGFTLIELMIVVAIIGILASIAVPAYQEFIAKAEFKEVMNTAAPYKAQVKLCASERHQLTGCHPGGVFGTKTGEGRMYNFIANPNITAPVGAVDSLQVLPGGIISVLSNLDSNGDAANETMIWTPTRYQADGSVAGDGVQAVSMQWVTTGTCTDPAGDGSFSNVCTD